MGFDINSFASGFGAAMTAFFIAWVLGICAKLLNVGAE